MTSGLFLQVGREIAEGYPDIAFTDLIVDNMAMQLVRDPTRFDVIVTTNLFGDILSDLTAGLVGGLGLVPGANIGEAAAIFEAVHGTAPDIAGRGVANPTAVMLAGAMMLDRHGPARPRAAARGRRPPRHRGGPRSDAGPGRKRDDDVVHRPRGGGARLAVRARRFAKSPTRNERIDLGARWRSRKLVTPRRSVL